MGIISHFVGMSSKMRYYSEIPQESEMTDPSILLHQLVRYLLRPLARILLRSGMSYGEFAEASKAAFVDAAQHDLLLPGRKQTTSRISTITGLSRKLVHSLLNQSDTDKIEELHKLNRAARVINGWISDKQYLDQHNKPKALSMESGEPNFSQLVKQYSGDITARTIADELLRIGAIENNNENKLILIKMAYIPNNNELEQLKLLSQNTAELLETIDHNLQQTELSKKRFQRKVYYNNIPFESVSELKPLIEEKAQACLQDINKILVQFDCDHNKNITGTKKIKIGLAMHYIEEEIK